MSDGELAGYILEKFQRPDAVQKRGKDGVVIGEAVPPPTLQGVCFELGITASEFEARCRGSRELSRAVELCYQREYDLVFRGGLSGALNGNFSGLVMKNRHEWREKTESSVQVVEMDEQRMVAALEFLRKRNARMGKTQQSGVIEAKTEE